MIDEEISCIECFRQQWLYYIDIPQLLAEENCFLGPQSMNLHAQYRLFGLLLASEAEWRSLKTTPDLIVVQQEWLSDQDIKRLDRNSQVSVPVVRCRRGGGVRLIWRLLRLGCRTEQWGIWVQQKQGAGREVTGGMGLILSQQNLQLQLESTTIIRKKMQSFKLQPIQL